MTKAQTKAALLEALEKSLGVVATACKMCGIDRKTYYNYYNGDNKFKQKVDELNEVPLDFVESKLFELIKGVKVQGADMAGNEIVYKRPPCKTSIIFYLKTKGKKRGYVETKELDVKSDGAKLMNWTIMPVQPAKRDDES